MIRSALSKVLSIALIAIVLGCSKGSEPVPESSAITITVSDAYVSNQNNLIGLDVWVFTSDKSGNPIDVLDITSPGTFTLKAPVSEDTITFSTFYASTEGGVPHYNGSSYRVKRNFTWSFDVLATAIQLPTQIKGFNIVLNNFPAASQNQINNAAITNGFNGAVWPLESISDPTLTSENSYYDSMSFLITSHDADGKPFYKWIHTPDFNQPTQVAFSDLIAMPYQFTAPTTSSNFFVSLTGFFNYQPDVIDASGFILSSLSSYGPNSSYKVGYLKGFDKYKMQIGYDNNLYSKFGSLNSSPEFPTYSSTAVNHNFLSVDISSNGAPYDYVDHLFFNPFANQTYSFSWTLVHPKGTAPKITALPASLKARYNPDLSSLGYLSSRFTYNLDGYTYENRLSNTPRSTWEYYQFQ